MKSICSQRLSKNVLIVDLCGTLIGENTTNAFIDTWLQLRGWRRTMRAVCGGKRPTSVLALMGLSREYLYSRAEQYVEDRIERFGNPVVLRAIREAQSVGTPVYLATASLDPIAHAVTRQLGFTGVVCARLRYCGKNKLCAGVFAWDTTGKKLKNLQTIVPLLLLQHATVYTDNWEDVDLLRVAKCVYFYGERQDLPSLTSREIHKITFLARVGKRRTNECN